VTRLTVAQALVKFLANQYSERDGVEQRLIPGTFGIFGHGNVAGVGQALLEVADSGEMPYHLARNEQGMVHAAVGFSRMRNRLQALACTASIGPGSTNMLTGAALATTNRIPVLLLPSDVFATRVASPVLQELEQPYGYDVSVNDAFRPLSKFFDRVWRPEQLPAALLGAMRVLTDPAETGAVTIALPQDVQAEAFDWPEELFAKRVWHIARPVPEPAALERAAAIIRGAQRPLVVAGGGVHYSEATEALRAFAEATGIPVGDTQAGKGALLWDHPQAVGGVGSTGQSNASACTSCGRQRVTAPVSAGSVRTRIAPSRAAGSCSGRQTRSNHRDTGRKASLTLTSPLSGRSSSCSSGPAARVAKLSAGISSTGSRLTVASAAPVTMLVAPGPMLVVTAHVCSRSFARA
jgi:3D-(3,5/4)-trihydroxycyclohexane-1,2-dione acylhydrolase (decyclizing)